MKEHTYSYSKIFILIQLTACSLRHVFISPSLVWCYNDHSITCFEGRVLITSGRYETTKFEKASAISDIDFVGQRVEILGDSMLAHVYDRIYCELERSIL